MRQNLLKIYTLIKEMLKEADLKGDMPVVDAQDTAEISDSNDMNIEETKGFSMNNKILTMFFRIGLLKSSKVCKINDSRINRIIEEIAQASGDAFERVKRVFLLYCSDNGNYGNANPAWLSVCGTIPDCGSCNLSSLCSYWKKRPSIKQLPASERPRERLIQSGEEQLSDAELLGIIIRDGTRRESAVDIARKLLSKYGNFRLLGSKTISELCKIDGIGLAKAAQIKAVIAIAKRYSTIAIKPGARLTSSDAIYRHFHEKLRDKKQEAFLLILLDNKNRILKEEQISKGSLTTSIVHPREVFGPAMREHAASVLFVHNHPSGDPSPSDEDIEITRRLEKVSQIVGIRVIDHIIIGDSSYISFKGKGLL